MAKNKNKALSVTRRQILRTGVIAGVPMIASLRARAARAEGSWDGTTLTGDGTSASGSWCSTSVDSTDAAATGSWSCGDQTTSGTSLGYTNGTIEGIAAPTSGGDGYMVPFSHEWRLRRSSQFTADRQAVTQGRGRVRISE